MYKYQDKWGPEYVGARIRGFLDTWGPENVGDWIREFAAWQVRLVAHQFALSGPALLPGLSQHGWCIISDNGSPVCSHTALWPDEHQTYWGRLC